MTFVLPTFKVVSVVFAISAVVTGTQAILDPIGFSRSFGLPIPVAKDADKSRSTPRAHKGEPGIAYVSLMGVRQLATGITLLMFAYQQKWAEMATILSILGIVVAGTDGIYLSRSGNSKQARFHAIPGALIALLAGAIVVTEA